MKDFPDSGGEAAGRNHATRRQCSACNTCWTHGSSSHAAFGLVRTSAFCSRPDAIEDISPAFHHTLSVGILNKPEGGVVKLDQRSAVFLAQPVLHIRDSRIGHEQRSRNFEQRRPLDGLHVSPEVSVAIAQVAVPPVRPARARSSSASECRPAFHSPAPICSSNAANVVTSDALTLYFLSDVQRQILDSCFCRNHRSSLCHKFWSRIYSLSLKAFASASARSLIRFNWCCQKRSNVFVHSCSGRMASALVR